MSLMSTMDDLFAVIDKYATRIIGGLLGTVTILCASGIIHDTQLKYWTTAIAMLTYWRGHATAGVYNAAVAAVAAKTEQPDRPKV